VRDEKSLELLARKLEERRHLYVGRRKLDYNIYVRDTG
jgi:hypothetical protein